MVGLVIDVIAAFLLYYGKIFRSTETIEQMSKHGEHEIRHRLIDVKQFLVIFGTLVDFSY